MKKEKISKFSATAFFFRYKSLCLFVLGLSVDLVSLGRIDKLLYLIQHAIYLITIFMVFVRFNLDEMRRPAFYWKKFNLSPLDIVQFFYGSLLSHYFYFYFRSTGLVTWFFLIFITLFLFLNELAFEKKWYFSLKIILFPFCTLAYLVYLVPIITGTLGIAEFYLSLIIFAIFMILLPYLFLSNKSLARKIWLASFLTLGVTLFLYQNQFIPPVPLHVTKSGFFTHQDSLENSLLMSAKKSKGFKSEKVAFVPEAKIFYVAKIFSPENFRDKLYLEWWIKNNDNWSMQDRIVFEVTGKDEGDYRGVAWKEHWGVGQYQILLLTEDDRILDKKELEVLNEVDFSDGVDVSDTF